MSWLQGAAVGGPLVGVLVGSVLSGRNDSRRVQRERLEQEQDEFRKALGVVVRAGLTLMTAEMALRPFRKVRLGSQPRPSISSLPPEEAQRIREQMRGQFDLANELGIAVTVFLLVKTTEEVIERAIAWKDSILAIRLDDEYAEDFDALYEDAGRTMTSLLSASAKHLNALENAKAPVRVVHLPSGSRAKK